MPLMLKHYGTFTTDSREILAPLVLTLISALQAQQLSTMSRYNER